MATELEGAMQDNDPVLREIVRRLFDTRRYLKASLPGALFAREGYSMPYDPPLILYAWKSRYPAEAVVLSRLPAEA